MKEEKEKKQKKKLEGFVAKPGEDREKGYQKFLEYLKKQGITITKE